MWEAEYSASRKKREEALARDAAAVKDVLSHKATARRDYEQAVADAESVYASRLGALNSEAQRLAHDCVNSGDTWSSFHYCGACRVCGRAPDCDCSVCNGSCG